MPKAPKPSKLIFMVKTAKRRTHPEIYQGKLMLEHDQCHAWYKYISGELSKIAALLNTQDWPPYHVTGTTFTPKPANDLVNVVTEVEAPVEQEEQPQPVAE